MEEPRRKQLRHFNDPGHVHEITFSCQNRLPLLIHDPIRNWLIDALHRACKTLEYDLVAYVVMPEHVHLLVRPRRSVYNVSDFLRSVKQSVSRKAKSWLHENEPATFAGLCRRSRRSQRECVHTASEFRFWLAGGGYDRNVRDAPSLIAMAEYIHNNPVRRGLVATSTDWRWSSARDYAGHSPAPTTLADLLGQGSRSSSA
jgi:putative transposase